MDASAVLARARWRLLTNVVRALEPMMAVLGLIWLGLLVFELTVGPSAGVTVLNRLIWAVFVLDFLVEFAIAPRKRRYLRKQWLTVVALALPAVRAVRVVPVLRAARTLRGVRLLRTLTSLNRAIGSLRATMGRRGFAYVMAMTVVVTVGGAAGMYAFEREVPDPAGLHTFVAALWWTAMVMTTMGSAYWPQTAEGRVLCVLLALYAFAVFGYVTATLATFFITRDAERPDAPVAGQGSIERLQADIAAIHELLTDLQAQNRPPDAP